MTAVLQLRALAVGTALSLCLAAPALADGMAKFEQLIKPQLPEGSLTYKSGKGLGDNGFVLEGVVVTPPPLTWTLNAAEEGWNGSPPRRIPAASTSLNSWP